MATLTVQTVSEAGLEPAYVAAAALGDAFKNNGRTMLHAQNGSGGALTVTVTAQQTAATVPGLGTVARASLAIAIPAGEERMIGPFAQAFNDADGNVQVTYSGVTSLTVAAIELPRAA